MLHLTYGLYPNDSHKRNAVAQEHLESHIKYNLDFRPGRALIVDGVVVHRGQVSEEVLNNFLAALPEWHPQVCSIPYV